VFNICWGECILASRKGGRGNRIRGRLNFKGLQPPRGGKEKGLLHLQKKKSGGACGNEENSKSCERGKKRLIAWKGKVNAWQKGGRKGGRSSMGEGGILSLVGKKKLRPASKGKKKSKPLEGKKKEILTERRGGELRLHGKKEKEVLRLSS